MKGSQKALLQLVQSGKFIKTINALLKLSNAKISKYDNWMPRNSIQKEEAELKDFLRFNFSEALGINIIDWWLGENNLSRRTPKWDLVSTCTLGKERGILLVEVKAHWGELNHKGKGIAKNASKSSQANHKKIKKAIDEANGKISTSASPLDISIDKCYQLSNRVAHAWWLANQGIPVVLLYLGILNCSDMRNGKKNKLFSSLSEWRDCFEKHAKLVGVDTLLDQTVDCGKSSFITLCEAVSGS